MKIVLCSDNHSNFSPIRYILDKYPKCDYYWHLGDSEAYDLKELEPFISVLGNNDFYVELPKYRIINVANHNFLLIHGTNNLLYDLTNLASYAKEKGCDTVLYGHTHVPKDCMIDGIRLINPGSCFYNRDGSKPSFAILNIDKNGNIKCDFKTIDID